MPVCAFVFVVCELNTHTHTHTYPHEQTTHTDTHTKIHSHTHAHTNHIHPPSHTHTHTHTHTTHTHSHPHICSNTHTHFVTYIHGCEKKERGRNKKGNAALASLFFHSLLTSHKLTSLYTSLSVLSPGFPAVSVKMAAWEQHPK